MTGTYLMARRPTRAGLIGLLIGTGVAMVAALGPLVSAITITIGVETQVGDASGLPDARMLPAALEGVGAVALVFLLTRRPAGRLRATDLGPGDAPPDGEDGRGRHRHRRPAARAAA